jgi:poly(3-hydroxybutyrate) depolymerase
MTSAANEWDDATNQNLFSDAGVKPTSYNDPNYKVDTYDGKNVAGWKYLSSAPSALAYSRTWYSLDKQGTPYYSARESDLSFNTRYGWSTKGNVNYDVRTVAIHELGHTIGLGDLYGKSQFASDTRQVMHYYTGPGKHLGNGDKNGAWVLYG